MAINPTLLVIFLIIAFCWLGMLTFLFWRVTIHYNSLTKGTSKKDLLSLLDKLIKEMGDESRRLDGLVKATEKINKENTHNVQKIGLVRFNPFAGTGGDQSFCLALLDGEESGLVISSLHSRDATRVYAKPVKKGKSAGYQLSTEEVQAIKNAKKFH